MEYQTKFIDIAIPDKSKNSRIRLVSNYAGKKYSESSFISGSIVDSNGSSISGINVRISSLGLNVLTDDNGKFSFDKIKDKKYEIEIETDGFQVQKYLLTAPTKNQVFVFNYKKETISEILSVFGRSRMYDDVTEENVGSIK